MTDSDRSDMSDFPEAPCGECGRPTNRQYVPIGVLEELIERWMRQQESYPDSNGGKHAASAVRCCADELKEIINDYGDTDE